MTVEQQPQQIKLQVSVVGAQYYLSHQPVKEIKDNKMIKRHVVNYPNIH